MGVADWLRDKLTGEAPRGRIADTSPAAQRPLWMREGMRAMEIHGHDDLRVVVAPGRQDALWAVVGDDAGEPVRQDVHALLVAEHNDPTHGDTDGHAVAVWLGGQRVGHLADEEARRLRPGLIRLQRRHRRAVALPGHVVGDRRDGLEVHLCYDAPTFGVRRQSSRASRRNPV